MAAPLPLQAPGEADPAGPRSLRDEAYEAIKQRIIRCAFRPGETLSEAAVSALLGIGRTPVRQAFDRLMRDRLVEVMPRKGIVVRPITQDEIADLIAVRLLNDSYAARLAAERADRRDLALLDYNLATARVAAADRDVEHLMELDLAFHLTLCGAAGNGVLGDILQNLHERSQRVWFVSLRVTEHHARVVDEHRAIVDAVRAHDATAAEEAMRAHVLSFRDNLQRQL